MSNIRNISKIREILEDLIARRPSAVVIAFRDGETGMWTTSVHTEGVNGFLVPEMIGMVEVLKAELVDHYFEHTEIVQQELLRPEEE
jgi:hypothetical protein